MHRTGFRRPRLFNKKGLSIGYTRLQALKTPESNGLFCDENNTAPSPDALLAFDALARQGSFTAAAEALGCAKSRVSQLVKELERDLGAVLVLRNTRRVALTEAGVRLAQHAARLRELLERVKPDIKIGRAHV